MLFEMVEFDTKVMTTKKQTERTPDHYIFPNTDIGRALRTETADGLLTGAGITSENGEEIVAGTTLLTLEVTGKRPGAGRIAEDMKARRDKRRTDAR